MVLLKFISQEGGEIMLIVLLLILPCIVALAALVCGNFWCSREGVLQEIHKDCNDVSEILSMKRHWFSLTEVETNGANGVHRFLVDTNIFFVYEIHQLQ